MKLDPELFLPENEFNGYCLNLVSKPLSIDTNFHSWTLLKNFAHLNAYWFSGEWCWQKLPKGYDFYFVKVDTCDFLWLYEEAKNHPDSLIFVINGALNTYGAFDDVPNVHWFPWTEIGYGFVAMRKNFGCGTKRSLRYKISALSRVVKINRIISLGTCLRHCPEDELLYSFGNAAYSPGDWDLSESGHAEFDALLKNCAELLPNEPVIIDPVNHNGIMVHDRNLINGHHFAPYQDVAININNETMWHTYHNGHTIPGPWITEKTYKCLIAGTAFLSNGQHSHYEQLKQLGFQFDYGDIDLSYDRIVPELDRMVAFANELEKICYMDKQEIFDMTYDSCMHNIEHIQSKKIDSITEAINLETIEKIQNIIQ